MEYSTSKWNGKKIVTFGDSITWYDGQTFIPSHREGGQIAVGYQSYMRKHLGAVFPVPHFIPKKIRQKLDSYFGRQ